MGFPDELVPLEGAKKLYLSLDLSIQTVALSLSLECTLLGHGSFAHSRCLTSTHELMLIMKNTELERHIIISRMNLY